MPLGWGGVKKIVDSDSIGLLLFVSTDRMRRKDKPEGRESL